MSISNIKMYGPARFMYLLLFVQCLGCAKIPRTAEAFGRRIPWKPLESMQLNRAEVSLPPGDPYEGGWLRRAIWNRNNIHKLVVLHDTGLSMGGDWWTVKVLNEQGQVEREGRLHCESGAIPYCLVEVYTDNAILPREDRNHWILAIGLVLARNRASFRAENPIRFYAGENPADSNPAVNWIDVEPVEWKDAAFGPGAGTSMLAKADCLCRPAEKELHHATVQPLNRR
jgi:hypothetical protein